MATSKTRAKITGRVRSLAEAERLLNDDLPSIGRPRSDLRAVAVSDPDAPEILAEFAARIVLVRKEGRLTERGRDDRIPRAAAKNLWWIAYGSLVQAADGAPVIGSLTVAPRSGLANEPGDVFLGVTAELLRVVSPAKLITETMAYLRHTSHFIEARKRERQGLGLPVAHVSESQTEALARAAGVKTRLSRVPEADIAELAVRYVTLYRRGNRRPTAQLAAEYGLTATQVRDRIHRARELRYLTGGKQGRAGAEPTPKLLDLWNVGEWG